MRSVAMETIGTTEVALPWPGKVQFSESQPYTCVGLLLKMPATVNLPREIRA